MAPALTIAVLGAIESLLSAMVADGMIEARHDSNQELIGQGLANIVTPFFGGISATAAIARTATNIRSGGKTPVAGIVHSRYPFDHHPGGRTACKIYSVSGIERGA